MRKSITVPATAATAVFLLATIALAQTWNTAGNALTGGSLPASPIEWIGSSNAADWIVKTSGVERMRISSTGSLLLDGNSGGTPATGSGTRMMWISGRGAFRAGVVGAAQWDASNIGFCSFAGGYQTTASGNYSAAFGSDNIASGERSFAIGLGNSATGIFSFASGNRTVASARTTTAFGDYTTAQSYGSFVIGRYNSISGNATSWVPADPLFVIGNGADLSNRANAVTVLKNGNVGIGLSSPPSRLALLSGSDKTSGFSVNRGDVHTCIYNQPVTNAGVIQVYAGGNATTIGANTYVLHVQPEGGSVEIGPHTANTGYRLSVNGDIRAKRIVVETGWSDFVFDGGYRLPNLGEVEKFIQSNHRLPGIPSAGDIAEKGGDLGQLVKLQMQKIEELTLYVIEQNKKIEALTRELESTHQDAK